MQKDSKQWKRGVYWFIFATLVISVYKLLDNFGDITTWLKNLINILMPFILALIVAYLFYLPCRKVESFYKKAKPKFIKNKARWLSIFTVYLIALLVILLIIKFVVPTVYESLVELANALPGYYDTMINSLQELPEDSILNKIDLQGIINNLGEINFAEYLSMERLTEYVKGILGLGAALFDVFVTIIVSMYLLAERKEIVEFARKLCGAVFNHNTYMNIGKYFRESNEIFFKFISSQILDGFVVGILTGIAMTILKVKYGILLGFFIGLFNLIPYLGAIVAVIIAIIITIFTGGISQAIWMAIIVIIIQQIDANIINPRIIGSSLKISPILIIFSVTVIGAYFGIIGMFLAVPIVAIIKLLVQDYIKYREENKKEEIE